MDCREFKDELLLYFGAEELPAELARHIEECPQCREEYEELQSMSAALGADSDFYPDDITAERLARQVEGRLEAPAPVTAVGSSWYGVVGLAASIALVASIAFFGNFLKGLPVYDSDSQASRLEQGTTTAGDMNLNAASDANLYEMSDDEFDILVNDYVTGRTYEAAGQLLDDISEEEFRYLEENFDVGDLL